MPSLAPPRRAACLYITHWVTIWKRKTTSPQITFSDCPIPELYAPIRPDLYIFRPTFADEQVKTELTGPIVTFCGTHRQNNDGYSFNLLLVEVAD
jgi:hypothetical protein